MWALKTGLPGLHRQAGTRCSEESLPRWSSTGRPGERTGLRTTYLRPKLERGPFGGRRFRAHSPQYTGRSSLGTKGSSLMSTAQSAHFKPRWLTSFIRFRNSLMLSPSVGRYDVRCSTIALDTVHPAVAVCESSRAAGGEQQSGSASSSCPSCGIELDSVQHTRWR